jgi:hypothetical protein
MTGVSPVRGISLLDIVVLESTPPFPRVSSPIFQFARHLSKE